MARQTLKQAHEEAGKVSTSNTKMPGSTFAVSATECNVGSRLAKVKGSTCEKCYALRLEKIRPSVHKGWMNNLRKSVSLIQKDRKRWVDWMVFQIRKACEKTGEKYHRWFDSGDIPSLEYLVAIAEVAKETPDILHWLPTREVQVVRHYHAWYKIPDSLIIRVSSPMVDDPPLPFFGHTSTVHSKGKSFEGVECEAYKRKNSCGPCRACWDKSVQNVSYPLH